MTKREWQLISAMIREGVSFKKIALKSNYQ